MSDVWSGRVRLSRPPPSPPPLFLAAYKGWWWSVAKEIATWCVREIAAATAVPAQHAAYPTTNGGVQKMEAQSEHATHCARVFRTFGADFACASRSLSTKILASEPSRKFIKSALLAGGFSLPPLPLSLSPTMALPHLGGRSVSVTTLVSAHSPLPLSPLLHPKRGEERSC